uniref:Guanylate cyclase domain-containing protein n=1 Tax=Dunaliella tertiolecta TaxID=3047 RepID=A0A7S3VSP0_DUNTE
MGEHVLGKGQEQVCIQLYQVLPRQLVHRAPQLGPVRSIHQLSHGFLEAPSNSAAICFMTVSYLKALELWNPDVTAAALKLWHTTVQGILIKRGGYLVEAGDGLCLAAFSRPSSAIRWALECIEACLNADWPAELLETEFGEEQYFMPMQRRNISRNSSSSFLNVPPNAERDEQVSSIGSVMPSASFPHLQSERVLFFRGLRMKVGIDWGAVKADLHAATARVTFRGRVMNRAARISSVAKCGQVWCSEGAWETAAQEINKPDPTIVEAKEEGQEDNAEAGTTLSNDSSPEIRFVNATPLGPYQLKGIAQNVELYHCY